MEVVHVPFESVAGDFVHIDKVLFRSGLCVSRSEAQRKIKEGAVFVDGERCSSWNEFVTFAQMENGFFLKLGRNARKVFLRGHPILIRWREQSTMPVPAPESPSGASEA